MQVYIRQKQVLYSLFREGYIDESAYEEALNYDVTNDFLRQSEEDIENLSHSYVYDLIEKEGRKIIMEAMYKGDGITAEQIAENSRARTTVSRRCRCRNEK